MDFSALIGKTIQSAVLMKRPQYDDEAWLRLGFTDGTDIVLVSSYGGYTGRSEDEYPTFICIASDTDGLVPVIPDKSQAD